MKQPWRQSKCYWRIVGKDFDSGIQRLQGVCRKEGQSRNGLGGNPGTTQRLRIEWKFTFKGPRRHSRKLRGTGGVSLPVFIFSQFPRRSRTENGLKRNQHALLLRLSPTTLSRNFFKPLPFLSLVILIHASLTTLTKCHSVKIISFFSVPRFCIGDKFFLCENKILCESDYEERLVFANMAVHPPSTATLAHIKRQVIHLQPQVIKRFEHRAFDTFQKQRHAQRSSITLSPAIYIILWNTS